MLFRRGADALLRQNQDGRIGAQTGLEILLSQASQRETRPSAEAGNDPRKLAMSRKRFWPDPSQVLLLGVCLHGDRDAAIKCWKEWKARVELDDLDHSSFHIMSLVCRRLLDL